MEKILGIVYAYDVKDAYQEILDLGFSWIRMGICFPWKDRMFGTLCEDYLKDREQMKWAHEAGIQIMPSTPGMGGYYYSETDGETRYRDAWPDFVGEKGTPEYYRKRGGYLCLYLPGSEGHCGGSVAVHERNRHSHLFRQLQRGGDHGGRIRRRNAASTFPGIMRTA